MGVAVAQAMLQGGTATAALVGTTIAAPLILPQPAASPAEFAAVVLRAEVACGEGSCRLTSGGTAHVSTRFSKLSGAAAATLAATAAAATERLAAQCTEPLATAYVYRRLAEAGLQYGPAFRLLRRVKQSRSSAAAQVQQPRQQLPAEFILNPAALDCCLQLGGMVPQQAAAPGSEGGTFVPAAVSALHVGASLGSAPALAAAQRPHGWEDSGAAVLRNHLLVSLTGATVCQLERLESRSTGGRARAAAGTRAVEQQPDMLYSISWAAADVAGAPHTAAQCGTALALTAGDSLQLAASSIAAVQGSLEGGAAALQLQSWGQHPAGGTLAGRAPHAAGQLWGLLRTVAQECQGLTVSGADADPLAPGAGSRPASRLCLDGPQPAQFDGYGSAAAAGVTFLPAMQRSAASSAPAPYHLFPQPRGSLNSLVALPVVIDAVAPGQVVVAVKAVGINFRWGESARCGSATECLRV